MEEQKNVEQSTTEPQEPNTVPEPEATPTDEPQEATAEAPAEDAAMQDISEGLDALIAERDQFRERYLRTLADMENLRRRLARDREEIRRTAAANVIEDLLPALDNLRIGLDSAANHPEAANVTKGFEFVVQQIEQTLSSHGLTRLSPEPGSDFDPNLHEAVAQQPHDTIADHQVISVTRVGYTLNERLLRAASVVVSSGPAEAPAE